MHETMRIRMIDKFAPFMFSDKRFKIAFGGRGGTKSQTMADILIYKVAQEGIKVGCFREHQATIEHSIHALLADEIERMKVPGFKVNKTSIDHVNGGGFRFRGLARHVSGVKSFHGFSIFFIEEAQFVSALSLKTITPTLREANSEFWAALNPLSKLDPISVRFIVPFLSELTTTGVYSDELHYIVWTNSDENPWLPETLKQEREFDRIHLSTAEFDHVWMGDFNDAVENALIDRKWFDACVDAHLKLGFKPRGIKFCSHDPSDTGPDAKGFAYRHGSVILDVQEKKTGDINEGGDWALELALGHQCDAFTWDCDGLGVGLKRQVSDAFDGKHTLVSMFKGSESVDFPDSIFEPVTKSNIHEQKTNNEVLKNKRAQYYLELRRRVYTTYRAVVYNEWADPDTMLSFSSSIKSLGLLRSELAKIPIKPSGVGLFELYTKDVMKEKFKLKSPNLADSIMMLMRTPQNKLTHSTPPAPIRPMGKI